MGVFKKGRHWYIDYYVKGVRKRKKIGPSKQVAELALAQVEVKIAKGDYLGNSTSPTCEASDNQSGVGAAETHLYQGH